MILELSQEPITTSLKTLEKTVEFLNLQVLSDPLQICSSEERGDIPNMSDLVYSWEGVLAVYGNCTCWVLSFSFELVYHEDVLLWFSSC